MTTTINYAGLEALKSVFANMGKVEISEPIIYKFSFEVTWANIFTDTFDGTNAKTVKDYYAEDEAEARQDLQSDLQSLSHLGYRVKAIRRVA